MTEIEMTSLLFKLADIGITGIKVQYDGGGDNGAIEWIGYTNEPCASPEDVFDNIDAWENDNVLEDKELYDLIEDFAQSKILNNLEDWWNDEGGFGNLCILVPSGDYSINNHIRVIETVPYYHEGNLIDKSLEE
jgi:hypothetical protein